jgi:hypothetical protein
MQTYPSHTSRQASALLSLEADVGTLLCHWECSDCLSSDGGKKILAFILSDKRLKEALREIQSRGANTHSLATIIEDFSNGEI